VSICVDLQELKFTKMHGIGNDFVVIDCLESRLSDPQEVARTLCKRRMSVGADQMLVVLPSDKADFQMEIYNADGGRVEMCGNGIRAFYKWLLDRGITEKDQIEVETLAGIIRPARVAENMFRVDMGEPVLEGSKIPTTAEGNIINYPLVVKGTQWNCTAVSMGNPHCVLFVDDPNRLDLERIGPLFENNRFFPQRTNTEFVAKVNDGEVRARVWERGTGETLGCGTGACAIAVAGVLTGNTSREVTVHLPGGDLQIVWDEASNRVFMTGPAEEVFEATYVAPC
jgi:diaminopimelate epimerase